MAAPRPARRLLRLFLEPSPGRLHTTLLLTAAVLVVATIWEVFRLPEMGVACSLVFFGARGERRSSEAAAGGMALLTWVGVAGAMLIFMTALSEPALRITLMALLTFVTMLLSRTARAGAPLFVVGFIAVYASTLADSMYSLSLSPDVVGNVEGAGTPGILLMPPEDALTRMLLWLGVAFCTPNAVVVVLMKVAGVDPAALLRDGLASRLRAAERWLRGGPQAELEAVARRGTAELLALAGTAAKEHGAAEPAGPNRALVRAATRLVLACVAAAQTSAGADGPAWRAEAARRCAVFARGGVPWPEAAAEDPIGREALRALDNYGRALADKARPQPGTAEPAAGFWLPDARRPANWQFALKVTLAVMTCYVGETALDWSQIGTSVVTCFLVALGSVGESGHKMAMRLGGALVGATMGIGAILLLMPLMTDVGQLLLLVAAGAFVAGWVVCGSQRISYTGLQVALAFFLTVLQDFGPTLDMQTARDRVVGILIGNVVSYLVLGTLWPERVGGAVATSLADGMAALARLLRLPGEGDERRPAEDEARERFAAALAKVQTLLLDTLYEGAAPGEVALDETVAERVQALVIPVAMIRAGGPEADRAAVAAWLDAVEARLRAHALRADGFPPPPSLEGAGRGQELLRRDLRDLPFAAARPDGRP